MERDRFEVLTDVKRVTSLTEETLTDMFVQDVSDGAVVYLDGEKYYATHTSRVIDDAGGKKLTFRVDEQPPKTLREGRPATIVFEGASSMDWSVETTAFQHSSVADGEYSIRLQRPTVSIL